MGKGKEATVEKLYENLANHLRQKVVEQSNLQNELLACSYVLVHVNLVWMLPSLLLPCCTAAHIPFYTLGIKFCLQKYLIIIIIAKKVHWFLKSNPFGFVVSNK